MKTDCTLDIKEWGSGSVAVWGAVSPIYNTASQPAEKGVHVHARHLMGGVKEIDDNFVQVIIKNWKGKEKPLTITAEAAIHYMVAAVFGLKIERVRCLACNVLHLEQGWYSVNPHQNHLCISCKSVFFEIDAGLGNPLAEIEVPPDGLIAPSKPEPPLQIRQGDYPGGIQVWGTNPAIFWKNQNSDGKGIHLHAFDKHGNIAFDETVPSLTIDGLPLDEDMVRIYMAQSVVPHLHRSVCHISCPRCGTDHFDKGVLAHTPHKIHTCSKCRYKFEYGDGFESIGNPLVNTLARLEALHCN